MATTGFWPVKNRLKEVIDYARNPDKTTDKKYLDEDLYNALRYVKNDDKTDKRMYVSGINCPTKRAYYTINLPVFQSRSCNQKMTAGREMLSAVIFYSLSAL